MKNKLFCIIIIFLLILGLDIFFFHHSKISHQENRKLKNNEDVKLSSFVSDCNDVLSDQFYFRDNISNVVFYFNSKISSLFGDIVIDDMVITPLSNDIVIINDEYYSNNALDYNQESLDCVATSGYNINQFDLLYPNIKTYVYKCSRIEELINVECPFQEKCFESLLYQMNPNITYSKLMINDFSDYHKYFFKTDHHWNAIGAYQGYCDIINMINKDYDIGEPKEIEKEIIYPYEFKGNIINNIYLDETDNINDLIIENIGDFNFYIDDKKCDYFETKNKYKEFGNDSIYTDYEYYYGVSAGAKLFDFKNEDKPNLLIIGSSYCNVNCAWIASHFNKTLFIDVWVMPYDYSLKKYIDKYDIDVALVQMGQTRLYDRLYIPLD